MNSQQSDPAEIQFLDQEQQRKTAYGIAAAAIALSIFALAVYGTLQLTAA